MASNEVPYEPPCTVCGEPVRWHDDWSPDGDGEVHTVCDRYRGEAQ